MKKCLLKQTSMLKNCLLNKMIQFYSEVRDFHYLIRQGAGSLEMKSTQSTNWTHFRLNKSQWERRLGSYQSCACFPNRSRVLKRINCCTFERFPTYFRVETNNGDKGRLADPEDLRWNEFQIFWLIQFLRNFKN